MLVASQFGLVSFHLGTLPVLPSGNSADVTLIQSRLTFLLFFLPLSILIWTPFYNSQVLLRKEMRVMIKDMLRDKIMLQLFIFADGFDYHSYIGKDFRGRNKAFSIPSGIKSHVLLSDGHLNSVEAFSFQRGYCLISPFPIPILKNNLFSNF